MKFVFIIERLSQGGAERVTALLANELVKRKHSVRLIILEPNSNEYLLSEAVNKTYISLTEFNKYEGKNKFFRIHQRHKKIREAIKADTPDYIISLSMSSTNAALLNLLVNPFRRFKIITSERNDPVNHPKSKLERIIRMLIYTFSDKVIFQTSGAKEYFPNFIQSKSTVIPNPITSDLPSRFEGTREKVIVNFCRLDSQKNIPLLIDAFSLLLKKHPDYRLVIYGEGPIKNELIQYSRKVLKSYSNQISFLGFMKNIHHEILNAGMYVSSSDYEGISNSMLESLAIGLPTVCTDCPSGGARAMIENQKNGLLVPVNNPNELYKAMRLVIENRELANNLSLNATKIRRKLSPNVIADTWIDYIVN